MSLNVCFILMIYLVCHFILQVAAYDTKVNKMAFFDPSRAKDFLFISGTKVLYYQLFSNMFQNQSTKNLNFVMNIITNI